MDQSVSIPGHWDRETLGTSPLHRSTSFPIDVLGLLIWVMLTEVDHATAELRCAPNPQSGNP